MKVIMTCGGTGGHIYPAIAIADEIRRRIPETEVLFVGAETGLEKKLVPENGYEIELIPAGGFNRRNMVKNVKLIKTLKSGNAKAKKILKDFRPDVVIGTGGYASAPIMKAAQNMKIKTYVHEQNAFPGMTNKLLEKKVEKLFLGFEDASKYFKYPEKHVVTGNPVRREFFDIDRRKAREDLGFKPSDFVLMAFGGSQGAGRINKAMLDVIETFNGVKDFKICMATGSYYYDAIKNELAEKGVAIEENIIIMEYIYEMAKYLKSADLVICRSGALSVAEVTVCGIPAIFIPSPNVTGNHQFFNAKAVADKGGAVVVEEKDLDDDELINTVLDLKNNPERMKEMAEYSRKCGPDDAVGIICDSVVGCRS